jgi:hypothetical protein
MLAGMLGLFVSRFRVLALLLAFGLGLAGQAVSNAAMASQMQMAMQPGISSGASCPGCPDAQHGGMAPGCPLAACWTIPALPAQGTALLPRPPATFPEPTEAIITGIKSAPDPRPPRAFLYS